MNELTETIEQAALSMRAASDFLQAISILTKDVPGLDSQSLPAADYSDELRENAATLISAMVMQQIDDRKSQETLRTALDKLKAVLEGRTEVVQ